MVNFCCIVEGLQDYIKRYRRHCNK